MDGTGVAVTADPQADAVAAYVHQRQLTLGVAESLTGGLLSSRLAAAPNASDWFAGGIVAYSKQAKEDLLGVSPGPVVTQEAALAMAQGAARLFRADVTVATTGVGGPGDEEGHPPGTVWVATCIDGRLRAQRLELDGDPKAVCDGTCDAALQLLLDQLGDDG